MKKIMKKRIVLVIGIILMLWSCFCFAFLKEYWFSSFYLIFGVICVCVYDRC